MMTRAADDDVSYPSIQTCLVPVAILNVTMTVVESSLFDNLSSRFTRCKLPVMSVSTASTLTHVVIAAPSLSLTLITVGTTGTFLRMINTPTLIILSLPEL